MGMPAGVPFSLPEHHSEQADIFFHYSAKPVLSSFVSPNKRLLASKLFHNFIFSKRFLLSLT